MPRSSAASRPTAASAEKSFYLDEFRSHTLCFSTLADGDLAGFGTVDLCRAIGELLAHDTRVLVLVGMPRGRAVSVARLRRALADNLVEGRARRVFARAGRKPSLAGLLHAVPANPSDDELVDLWAALRKFPIYIGVVPADRLLATSERIAGRLRLYKWVVLEKLGGIAAANGSPISFIDDSVLTELLRTGAAEWSGVDERRDTLGSIQATLRQGVGAVNLCAPDQVGAELFTYEGSGTLFTLEDYCRIEPLGIDDFDEVEQLLERGHREGFLKARDRREIGTILINGFGARVGQRHLAGICSLLTEGYERAAAGEVAGLYTFTRFKGEGIGARLLEHLVGEARNLRLKYIFACTTDAKAADFFVRHGFATASRRSVPAAKWRSYDQRRLRSVQVLRRDLRPPSRRRSRSTT